MNGVEIESVQCAKDLGVTIVSSLKFPQQCKDAAGKVNRILDMASHLILTGVISASGWLW